MPISSLTAIVGIPEGSEATPGLFNSRFSQLQQNLQELNTQAIGLLSGFVSGGVGAPESIQTGNPGFLYTQSDATTGEHPLWVKYTGSGTTGWVGYAGFKGDGADSYRFGRGAAATGENSSAFARSAAARGAAAQAWGYLATAQLDSDLAAGPNSRASGPNAIALGLNAYAGYINAGALGSAVTSNATGAWSIGAAGQSSHQSAMVFSATPVSSRSEHEFFVNYPHSAFSGAVRVIRHNTYAWDDYFTLSNSSSTAYIGYGSVNGGLAFRPPEDAAGGTFSFYDASGSTVVMRGSGNTVTMGLNVIFDQADDDAQILMLKSSDVAHGITDLTPTGTYGFFDKQSPTLGGARFAGVTESTVGVQILGAVSNADTTKSSAADAAIYVNARRKSGTGLTGLGANGNIMVIATDGAAKFIFDADGDSHQDVGTAWTNFDTHDDIALLNQLSAHVTRDDDPLRGSFAEWLQTSRSELERLRLVTFDADGRPFMNMSRLAMLHTGALRQLGEKLDRLEATVRQLQPGTA